MNVSNAKTPCRQAARHCNQPRIEVVFKRFLPVVAGTWLLLAAASASKGGCLADPCKFPSLGYLFTPSPSFHHHRHDDASGTFCAPCYGYHATCWREWPDCCVGFPPPPVSVYAESSAVPLPTLPPPKVIPAPAAVPVTKQPPLPTPPRSGPAIPPPPSILPSMDPR